MKKPLIIWGATGQSIVLEDILGEHYDIIALFDNNESVTSPFTDIPLYFKDTDFDVWLKQQKNHTSIHYSVAIGGKYGKERFLIHEKLKRSGLLPVSAIHKSAFISRSADLGEGVQIMAKASVCARVRLGECTIVNTSASVDHECNLSSGVHIGPGATLAGCVTVGKNSFIGAGAVVLPHITIGEGVIVGAGSVVTKDIESNAVGYGNPFRIKS